MNNSVCRHTHTHTHAFIQLLIPELYSIFNPPQRLLDNSTPCFTLLHSFLDFDTYFVSACEPAHKEHFDRLIPGRKRMVAI